MKTKLFVFMLITVFLLLSVPLFAQDRIIDNAGILSADEKTKLEGMMQKVSSAYKFEFIILIEKTIGGKNPIDYSWDYLDARGLDGYEWDGCLLLQVTGGRDYAFTASGRGDKILNNTAYDKLEENVVSYLRQNEYFQAYEIFIKTWEYYLELDAKGRSYNFLHDGTTHLIWLIVAWVLSLIIGSIVVSVWKSKMNTVIPPTRADAYIIPGSLVFTQQSDRFLYSTVTKERKQSSSSSGGSSRSGGGRSSRSGKY